LHVSQPPFSKQIHDLEGELGIDLFARQRKGVALIPAGKSFLIDARRILEDCKASVRKAQRISRGEIFKSVVQRASIDERYRAKNAAVVGWSVAIVLVCALPLSRAPCTTLCGGSTWQESATAPGTSLQRRSEPHSFRGILSK
jgi:hypothetical protein